MPGIELTKASLAQPGSALAVRFGSPIEHEKGAITSLHIEVTGDDISISSRLENGNVVETYTADSSLIASSLSDDATRDKFLEYWALWAANPAQPSLACVEYNGPTEVHCPGGVLIYISTDEIDDSPSVTIDILAFIDDVDLADDEGLVASMFANNMDIAPGD